MIATLALAGCAGTELQFAGKVCGQDVNLTLTDRKDRSGFDATVSCGSDGGVTVTTSDSSTSAVIVAQAELAARLGDTVAKLAGAAAGAAAPAPMPVQQPATQDEVERLIWAASGPSVGVP